MGREVGWAGVKVVLTALTLPIILSASGEQNPGPPSEFQLFANGETATLKGTFKCSAFSCDRVLGAMTAAGRDKLPIDYNHGQVSFMGGSYDAGRAAGWFVPASRDGALWATEVEWTPQGRQALSDKEFRMFSPAFLTDENRNVVELINVALTNLPATLRQTPLVTGEFAGTEEQPMDPILLALLAKHGGDSKSLAAAIEQLSTQNAQLVQASTTINSELQTLRATQVATAEATAKAEKDALIATLSGDGRLPPAMHAWAQSLTIAQLKAFEAGAPKPATAAPAVRPTTQAALGTGGQEDTTPANPLVRKVLQLMSVSSKDYMSERTIGHQLHARKLLGEVERDTVCSPEGETFDFDPDAPAAAKAVA